MFTAKPKSLFFNIAKKIKSSTAHIYYFCGRATLSSIPVRKAMATP